MKQGRKMVVPAMAQGPLAYQVPQNIFQLFSGWTDIVVLIGLGLEFFLRVFFGGYLLPEGLIDRDLTN